MKIVLAGAGAFGVKHLDAIKQIGGIEVASVTDVSPVPHNGCRPRKRRRV